MTDYPMPAIARERDASGHIGGPRRPSRRAD